MAQTTSTTSFKAMSMSVDETTGLGSFVFFIVVAVIIGGALVLYLRNRRQHSDQAGSA